MIVEIPNQEELDWDVVRDAIYEAVSNGEGQITNHYLKLAFQTSGIKVILTGEEMPIRPTRPAGEQEPCNRFYPSFKDYTLCRTCGHPVGLHKDRNQ